MKSKAKHHKIARWYWQPKLVPLHYHIFINKKLTAFLYNERLTNLMV